MVALRKLDLNGCNAVLRGSELIFEVPEVQLQGPLFDQDTLRNLQRDHGLTNREVDILADEMIDLLNDKLILKFLKNRMG